MKNFTYLYILVLTFALFASCTSENNDNIENTKPGQSSLYFNGDIITMEGDSPEYAEALVEQSGKILFVGTEEEAREKAGTNYAEIDLKGKTLVPGFIDGHAHFYGFGAQAVMANLLASPDGNCDSIPALITTLKEWHAANGTDKTKGWIVGMGFDDAVLAEKRFPTKEDLDQVSTEIPIMVIHISGHFSVVNSKGLELLNITSETMNPEGGVIRRMEGSNEPNGVLEELAAIPAMIDKISPTEPEMIDYYMDKGQEMAVRYGYTTAVEGRAMSNHEQIADYASRGKLNIDILSYIDYMFPRYMETEWYSKEYKNHYRIAGLKLTLDGSPQGRTAWRTIPYLIPPDGQKDGYSGYPAIPEDEKVMEIVDLAFANNWQLKTHCNGDAAFDQLCRALGPAVAKYGNQNRRNTLVHGQLIRPDQIDSLKKYDLIASLFPMHTFYWGDWYDEIIGPDKAQQISPIKSALNKGVRVTSHTDAPVALPNLMMIMWTTVNRVSRSGKIMGPAERLTPYEALQSFTIGGAYQFFEENEKGSLKAGKLADMVILDQNPLKVDPMKLKEIKVLQTIKGGKTVYSAM
ncbi:amidohydrolase [Fulvivirga sedimenti]|uniref:Amidohydrolase n=1 Tax=Fulvivirga sedimenti TaxID=2879465 RepID=A0A9X1KYE5_9BACT|nr:amidohydrolase [Fulvivirga sedimenti]MCA6074742.1 amidohydrolase [Fulvivirga sedimenti]MCA6075919.1 amidohydrolase [Fulvivirga sedimenti]MCA6077047.1 amidohydrolase [Fulvivirga sedimenti]